MRMRTQTRPRAFSSLQVLVATWTTLFRNSQDLKQELLVVGGSYNMQRILFLDSVTGMLYVGPGTDPSAFGADRARVRFSDRHEAVVRQARPPTRLAVTVPTTYSHSLAPL